MTQVEMIEKISEMDNERQKAFYASLKDKGFTDDDIFSIQAVVFYSKLFENPSAYSAVCKAMAKQLYAEFTK